MAQSSHPKIAIAGGGPGALTLALLLHQRAIPFTLFEMRPRPTPAQLDAPSGSLDLHEGSGLAALRACGLWEAFLPLTADCEESMTIVNRQGEVLHADQGGAAYRPEIARNNLTRILLEGGVPEDSVRWERKIVKVEDDDDVDGDGNENGGVKVYIQHIKKAKNIDNKKGQKEEEAEAETVMEKYDYLIGADGAWSKVRALLNPLLAQPQLRGIYWFTLTIPSITTRYPRIAEYVGRGMFLCLANGHMVCVMGGVRDSATVTIMLNCATVAGSAAAAVGGKGGEEEILALNGAEIEEVKRRVLGEEQFLGGFGERVKEVVRVGFDEAMAAAAAAAAAIKEDSIQLKPLVSLPAGYRWEHAANATLIGDAAHVMLPSGEGVNMAMWDALDVSRAIGDAWDECLKEQQVRHAQQAQEEEEEDKEVGKMLRRALSPRMKQCEEAMHLRAGKEAEASEEQNKLMFGENGSEDMAKWMGEMMRHAGGGEKE